MAKRYAHPCALAAALMIAAGAAQAQDIYPGSVSPMGGAMYGLNTGPGAAAFVTLSAGITGFESTGRDLQFRLSYDSATLAPSQVEDTARTVCSRFSLISIDWTHSSGQLDFQCLR